MSSKKTKHPIADLTFIDHEHGDDGDGNWLISYADLMTLLFGFFVILYSISDPNPDKLEKFRQDTSKSMSVEPQRPLAEIYNSLSQYFVGESLAQSLEISDTTQGLVIKGKASTFFASGSSKLKTPALELLKQLGAILAKEKNNIIVVVEGHTDDLPISTKKFPSNWELSSHRASEVVRLFESIGFPHESLRPLGLADTSPLIKGANLTDEEREKNRRVVIRVQKKLKTPSKSNDES